MKVYYYGPYLKPGHFFYMEGGGKAYSDQRATIPWKEGQIDGVLQPGCFLDEREHRWRHEGPEIEGEATIRYKDKWTALSFWDRTIDKRGGCNSTFIAEGVHTFDEMVEIAKKSFPERWALIKFDIKLHSPET